MYEVLIMLSTKSFSLTSQKLCKVSLKYSIFPLKILNLETGADGWNLSC